MIESGKPHSPHGIHLALECGGCRSDLLENAAALEEAMIGCARAAGATVVNSLVHAYNPAGLSGVVVIAESHLAVHTWPEIRYASFDIYTCGRRELAKAIARELVNTFEPDQVTRKTFERRPPSPTRKP